MGTTLHMLRGVVTSDIRGFMQGMGQVSAATKDLRAQWMTTANAIGSAAARITLALTGIGLYATKSFADFEDVMVEVGAISRTLGTQDFERLRLKAIQLGEDTRYSATEAAQAMKQLSLAGLSATQVIDAATPSLNLAAAAGISIAQAAGIAAKTMKAYGLEAGQLAHVNDVLVSTFTRANTDLVQLSEGLKHAAPLANTLGVSIEDTTAILAKMADAGFQGEMGGTALRNIMSRLAGAIPRATGELSRMGITTLDTTGKMRPLLDILQDIENAGMSAGDIMKIFGQRGGPQLMALLEVGVGSIKKFADETRKAGGVAERMMNARMKTLKGQFDELTSVVDSTFIELGERVAPVVKKLINEFEEWIRANKADVIHNMTTALDAMVRTLRDVIKWVADNRKELWGWAMAMAGVVKAIADFLSRHPGLMAALIALKVTGLLGVNNALWQMGGLIGSIGRLLGQTIAKWVAFEMAAKSAAAASAAAGAAGAAGSGAGAAGAAARVAGGRFASVGAGLAGNAGAAAATSGFTTALITATAKMGLIGVIVAQIAVVLHQLYTIFTAVSNQEAKNKQEFERAKERNNDFVKQEQSKQVEAIRNKRFKKQEEEGVDPGAGFTMTELGKEVDIKKGDAAFKSAELLKRQKAKQAFLDSDAYKWNPDGAANKEKLKRLKDSEDMQADAVGKDNAQIQNLKKAIGEEAQNVFNNLRDQVKNTDLRKDFSKQMTDLKKSFDDGAIPVEVFKKKLETLMEQLKKSSDDANAGTQPFQTLAKTRRRMEEGTTPDGKALPGGKASGVNFANFNSMLSALKQLNNVDKLWAEEIVKRAESEMAAVESLRQNGGSAAAIAKAEFELNVKLKELEAEAREATSATITDKLSRTQKEQKLTRRKDAAEGFEDFESQVNEAISIAGGATEGGLKNIGADAINQLAKGVEGATEEQKAQFIEDFKALQEKGPQKFLEGIEELTLAFVEGAEASKKAAEKIEENRKELDAALKEMDEPGGFMNRVGELKTQDPTNPGFAELERLKGLARENKIDAGEFDRKTGRVMTSLESGASAKEGATASLNSVAEQSAEQFGRGFSNHLQKYVNKQMTGATAKFNLGLDALQKEFLETDMSTDEFNRRLDLLKKELNETGDEALKTAAKMQRAEIIRGNFSSLNPMQEIQDRWFNWQMGRWNQHWDAVFQSQLAMMGLSDATNNLQQGFDQFNDGLARFGANGASWLENSMGGGGSGGDISGGLAALNSTGGQIAQLWNQIAGLNQTLQLTNVRESRKEEVRRQIDAIRDQIEYLSNPPPPMFIGTGSDPFFRDPGLMTATNVNAGAGTASNRSAGQSGGKGSVSTVVNFPNVNKFTSADASLVYDALEREAKRRGTRLGGVS